MKIAKTRNTKYHSSLGKSKQDSLAPHPGKNGYDGKRKNCNGELDTSERIMGGQQGQPQSLEAGGQDCLIPYIPTSSN